MGNRTGEAPPRGSSAFERTSTRSHFSILGRRLKGQSVNLAHSRSVAIEKRKLTLLQDYRQNGKAGGFIDRRFGEGDPTLDGDEKALRRLQRLRQTQFGSASRFALGDEEEALTHLGSALGDGNLQDDFEPSDEERDDELNEAITREYHFGGDDFFTKKKAAGPEDEATEQKTKKEVMAEIIAKSKASKRERAKEKEEDDDQLEELDNVFKSLADSGALRGSLRTSTGHLKAGRQQRRAVRGAGEDEEDDFDKLSRELAAEKRASKVSDRLRTPDELAAEQARQLAELERRRIKRMRSRGSDEEASSEDDEAQRAGGYASRRHKHSKGADRITAPRVATGDDLGDNYLKDLSLPGEVDEDGDEEEEEDDEEEEEEEDDGDDDELRKSFKANARSIARKGDLRQGKRRLRRLGLLDDGGSQSSELESGSDEDAEDDEVSGSDEEGEEEEESAEEEDEGVAAAPAPAPQPAARRVRRAAGAELPFVFEAPECHAQFLTLVDGRSAEDLSHVVSRIAACHAISLSSDNRRKMQVFFGILLVHVEVLAQQSPMPQRHLDALVPHLLSLSREVPVFAATAARARLAQAQAALAQSSGTAAWPAPRTLLLLRLFSLMFPASDFRHPVLAGAALLLGQYLARCEVRSSRDAAVGVVVATLAVRLASASRRYVPEAVSFLSALVHASAARGDAALEGLSAQSAYQTEAEDAWFQSAAMRASALCASLHVLAAAAEGATALPAAAALLAPVRAAVARLRAARFAQPALQGRMEAAALAVSAACDQAASAVHPPLQLQTRKAEAIKVFNPRFEEDGYVKGRNYDVDRERSEARRLKKTVAREAKGAARELRKDNRFLAEERSRVRGAEASERDAKYRSEMTWLQQQEAEWKSGGQGGQGKGQKKR